MASEQKNFCLIKNGNSLSLNKKHHYYFQVQAQIFICDVDYCDFVVWTMRDIHIERIGPDVALWEDALLKATKVFKLAVLPELLGRWFTKPTLSRGAIEDPVQETESDDEEGPWCFCQEHLEESELIGCDNAQCNIKWYHMDCLQIINPPEGNWYCPTCIGNHTISGTIRS